MLLGFAADRLVPADYWRSLDKSSPLTLMVVACAIGLMPLIGLLLLVGWHLRPEGPATPEYRRRLNRGAILAAILISLTIVSWGAFIPLVFYGVFLLLQFIFEGMGEFLKLL